MNKGWLELESDPGLFTLLLEDYGVNGVQVEEIYDLQKSMDGPVYGFIFLFRWIEERRSRRKTNTEVESFVTDTEAVNKIFFAQQIIPNSCATHALLSVLLNCDNKVKLGKTLNLIKDFTDSMSPEDKGYAIANMPELARVHNSFARPETSKPMPEKQAGLSSVRAMDSETFHFVSYVPIHGHLFELDGLKPYPIDHGPWEKGEDWTEKFRRVITDRLGMATGGEPYHDIRFNLMAVVPDKLSVLEHKLVTLKTNRNIVLEALQQLLDAKVVSPTSSEKSDMEMKSQSSEVKKSVTFTSAAPTVAPAYSIANTSAASVEVPSCTLSTSHVVTTDSTSVKSAAALLSSLVSQPSSILKTTSLSTPATATALMSSAGAVASDSTQEKSEASSAVTLTTEQMRLRSSAPTTTPNLSPPANPATDSSNIENKLSQQTNGDKSVPAPTNSDLAEHSSNSEAQTKEMKPAKDSETKQEPMDTTETEHGEMVTKLETKPAIKIETSNVTESKITLQGTTVSGSVRADITKPLSIETKFTTSPCAASNESTDTASEIGSGFSSPGSLNTSSCQSSPQYSDGNIGADGRTDGCEEKHTHRRKRRSSHVFTPKDLLDLLKNVENEIELCETNLKEENEKRKKYKIDACRRTHNYDQFIVTFLSMLAEQGLLGDLMEENMTIKKPGGNTATGPKLTKKAMLKVSEKKKKAKIKRKGKK